MSDFLTSHTNLVLAEFREDDVWGKGDSVLDQYLVLLKTPTAMPWASARSKDHALKVLTKLKSIFPLDPPPPGYQGLA